MKKILIIIVFIFVFKDYVFASDALDSLNIEQYDTIINNGGSYTEYSFSKTVKSILSGEGIDFNISSIIQKTISIVFKEVFLNSKIIKNVILIAFLSEFLKVLTESFKNQGVSELGFYTSYMVVAMLIVNSFNIGVGIVSDTISIVSNIINSIMPMLVGLLFMSGAGASATLFSTFIISTLKLLSFFITSFFIPFVSATAILNIINYITTKDALKKLIEFLKWLTSFCLKSIAVGLAFIISLQRIGAPMLNATINKTAKTFIGFVPVIGDAMTNAVDSIMHFVGLLKSGVLVALIIGIILSALVPILKLVALIFTYKITAVLIEPISDGRITSCVDSMGEYTKMILSCLILFLILFIFFIAMMLSISG